MNNDFKWVGLAKVISFLALLGFGASVVVHLAGLMGEESPFGWKLTFLHYGTLTVGFPAALLIKKLNGGYQKSNVKNHILRGCPQWMVKGMSVVFAYGMLNFLVFSMVNEFGNIEVSEIRRYSGHWLVFYYAPFVILYSYIQVAQKESKN